MEDFQQQIQMMRRNYLFSGLDDDQFQEVIVHAMPVELAAGKLLFSMGDECKAFYWVSEGLMRLFRISPQGEEKVIELIRPGRYFGEAALFLGSKYPINAAAQTKSSLIAIDSSHFRSWLTKDVDRCMKLLAGMSARLHKLINEIDSLSLMKGSDRLLQYLLDHSDPDESGVLVVDLEAPKNVIASRLGVKPETLSRLLHKLSDMGYIESRGGQLVILNEDGLKDINL